MTGSGKIEPWLHNLKMSQLPDEHGSEDNVSAVSVKLERM